LFAIVAEAGAGKQLALVGTRSVGRREFVGLHESVGARLARDAGDSVSLSIPSDAIAGKPCSHR